MVPKSRIAAGAGNTNGKKRLSFNQDSTIKDGAGRKPARLMMKIDLDRFLYPVWRCLPRTHGKAFFKALGWLIGHTRFYAHLGDSYIRFLNLKEAA